MAEYECECGNTKSFGMLAGTPLQYLPCDKCNGIMWLIDMSRDLPDSEAEKEIREFLTTLQKSGQTSVGLLDIIVATNLPSEQIERIMDKLSRGDSEN